MKTIAPLITLLALCFHAVGQQLPFGDLPLGVVKPTFGCVANAPDEPSRRACRIADLRSVDDHLNSKYDDLREQLQPIERSALQAAQREWIRKRDALCAVGSRAPERDTWLQHVAESESVTHCVLQSTQKRLAELESMYQRATTSPVFAQIAPQSAAPLASGGDGLGKAEEGYVTRSSRTRSSGKYYFEVTIDQAAAVDKLEALLMARVHDGRRWMGTSYHIRPRDTVIQLGPNSTVTIEGGNLGEIRLPKVILGVAVDLDAGRLYRRRDGQWLGGGPPGSPQGVLLRRNTEYRAEIASTVQLDRLVKQGVVTVNFGSTPFAQMLPVGYMGFDSADASSGTAQSNEAVSTYLPGEAVAGESQEQWQRRYWEWVRSFSTAENPSLDKNGFRCGAGQSGPVWFLTGSRESASIVRECEVPEGKILLVPLINALIQANPGADVGCDSMLVTLRQFSSGITGLRFQGNGKPLDQLEQYRLGTECFTLRDATTARTGLAAGTGYWVFIKPLKKGRHELSFGGRSAGSNFQQDIKYVLHVR